MKTKFFELRRFCVLPLLILPLYLHSQVVLKPEGPKKPPKPPLLTPSCQPGQMVGHCFNSIEFTNLAIRSDVMVIVSHGLEISDNRFDHELLHEEMCPVFVSPSKAENGLTSEQLKKVLQGQISDWENLGRSKGAIDVYLHGGELQKPAFEALMRKMGIDISRSSPKHLVYAESYDDLEKLGSKDPNALVIGLRKLKPKGLKPIVLDGVSILSPAAPQNYPLQENIYVYTRKGQANNHVLEKWKQEVNKNIPPDAKEIMLEQER